MHRQPRERQAASSVRPSTLLKDRDVQGLSGMEDEGDEGVGVDKDGADQGIQDDQEARVDEEVKKAVVMRRPYTPTQKEIEEHMPLHIPFRAWCPHCVARQRSMWPSSSRG